MVLRLDAATVSTVDAEGAARGARIKRRREEMLWPKIAMAKRAGISRDTLDRVEADADGVTDTTYMKVERALDDLAEELGFAKPGDTADHDIVRVEVKGIPGADAIAFEGHIDNLAQLEEAIARILRMAQQNGGASAERD